MSGRCEVHTQFVIERRLDTRLREVWRAWSDADAKRGWFACSDDMARTDYHLDFREGASEVNRLVRPDGSEHLFDAHYFDIVEVERIIYAYNMHLDDRKLSASLATVRFEAIAGGTLMTFTEQIAFLDGYQDPQERISGTGLEFDMLERFLAGRSH